MNKLERIKNKIVAHRSELTEILQELASKKIVFTNGCFDLLHKGHIDYLAKASDFGDFMIIGLNTDDSVSRLKGPHRPIQDQSSRAYIMAALEFVDLVVYFDEDTPYDLIKQVQPHVLVKGADYKPEDIVGYDVVMAKGGEVKTMEFLPGYSTSAIENKIKTT
ncbi:MAG: D-glycero-beta-D-manno-heptose 1-phosphate adenylyltransferase [Bacteroidetes bacterium 4572_77]|nr:MAG: D-glycero-beta-D-manno-heptose 1-phosphate adenylyltransferase [Bacteroidetes bacterium 4572_77]